MSNTYKWLALGLVICLIWLINLLSTILVPFISGILLAYLGDPLVDRLENMRFSRIGAVLIFFGVLLLLSIILLVAILPQLQSQLIGLMEKLPQIISWVEEYIVPHVVKVFGLPPDVLYLDIIKQLFTQNASGMNITSRLLSGLNYSGQLLFAWLGYLILIPVVTFYLLRDWDLLVAKVHNLIPRAYVQLVVKLAKQCDAVLADFLRGQLLVMGLLSLLYSIGLWIVGLDFFLLIGFLSGMLSFVPYLGLIVGVSVAGIMAFMQFHDFIHLFYILSIFGIVQLIESILLAPILVGDKIGLHPVTVIFVVMAGGQLFGFIGVLLALPVAAVLVVLLRHAMQCYLKSSVYAP